MELKHCFEIGWYNMYMIPITTVMSHEWQIYNIYNNLIPELIFKSSFIFINGMIYLTHIYTTFLHVVCTIIIIYVYNINNKKVVNIYVIIFLKNKLMHKY